MATVDTLRQDVRSGVRTLWTSPGFAGAAALTLALAAVGVYGVLAYTVSRRAHEIGTRLAIGADPSRVLAMVLRQGLVLAGAGVAIGVVAALGLTRVMQSVLYGVSPVDPPTFVIVAILLLLLAGSASYVPALRAMRVPPTTALRGE